MTPVSMLGTQTNVTFDLDEVHSNSLAVLKLLESRDASMGMGAAVCAMTLGRLMAPDPTALDTDDEIEFVQAVLEWAGTYWTEGGLN